MEIEPLLLRLNARQGLQLVEEGGQIDTGRRNFETTAIQFVQVNDVVEDIAKGHRTQVNGLELLVLLGIEGVSISIRLKPTMPLSGVRSSWLMVEMKVVLSRLAFSSLS